MKTVILSADKARINLREIWSYRDLLKNLALRDITVRYKQTWLGLMWALVKPCFNILVFGAISMLISKSANAADNFLLVGAGVIIWTLMVSCVNDSSNSVVSNANLLTKVYFPKLILPMASIFVCLVDFLISFIIYLSVFTFVKGFPGVELLLLPVFVFLGLLLAFGVGLMFAAANVKYRDVSFALPFLLQLAYYVSPVFLTTAFYLGYLPPALDKIFLANPLVFILDGFRYCLYGEWANFNPVYAGISLLLIFAILFLGVRSFIKFEKTFADFI